MGKLRSREVKSLAQGWRASKEQGWALNPGIWIHRLPARPCSQHCCCLCAMITGLQAPCRELGKQTRSKAEKTNNNKTQPATWGEQLSAFKHQLPQYLPMLIFIYSPCICDVKSCSEGFWVLLSPHPFLQIWVFLRSMSSVLQYDCNSASDPWIWVMHSSSLPVGHLAGFIW